MQTFTAFVMDCSRTGTTWIQAVVAKNEGEARVEAEKQCAAAWDCEEDDVECIGLAAGDVDIVFWED